MELSSITDKRVHQAQRAQIEQIAAVAKVLGLKVGSQFLADVQQVTQATPEERAQLVKSIEANLAQLNKNSAAPAIKALINELEAQKNIAQTPSLKLVTLALTTPALSSLTVSIPTSPVTPLLTYTNQPLQMGQTLLMQLSEGQRLQLLQPLTKAEIASFNALLQTGNNGNLATANSIPANSNPIVNGGITQSTLATSAPLNNEIAKKELSTVIGETLRHLLPQKDKGQDLLASLPKLTQFIQQLPLAQRQDWLSSEVQQSLKTLANHIRLSDQLTNPKLLEMALKNNGQSFEHKLSKLASAQQTNELTSPSTTTLLKPQKNSTTLASASLLTTNPASITNNSQITSAKIPLEKILAQDLKGALLGLLHQLDAELETTKPALTGSPLAADLNKSLLAIALPQFLGLLFNKQHSDLSQKQLRAQLVMLLHQHTLGSIAKIQLQQVHSLNHQLTQADQTQPTQSWQFEIPVRQGQDVHPLHIQMEQQWVEEEQDKAERNSTRVRQWNVMLRFDLPLVGQFYAQLTLLGEKLSAKFWAENESTLETAKNRIDELKMQLEREGIQITQMHCVPGLPPKPKMSLSYSLIDLKT